MDFGIFLCWKSTIKTSQWTRGGMRETKWQRQSVAANAQGKHKLAKLAVFFEVDMSSFHHHSEGGNNNKKQNKTDGKSNL